MKQLLLWCRKSVHALRLAMQDEKRRVNLLLCLGVAGMLLLAVSAWLPEKTAPVSTEEVPRTTSDDYAAALESRLEEMVEQMDGAGRTEVMVTLQTEEESIYATDCEVGVDGASSTSHVLVGGNALLETTAFPQILGVAVICEGGGEAAVQNRITTLVETLTGIGANHITVARMAPEH